MDGGVPFALPGLSSINRARMKLYLTFLHPEMYCRVLLFNEYFYMFLPFFSSSFSFFLFLPRAIGGVTARRSRNIDQTVHTFSGLVS